MAWADIAKAPLLKSEKRNTPDNFWERCTQCREILFRSDFEANQNVCSRCHFHFPIAPEDRVQHLLDAGSFVPLDGGLSSTDPLEFKATKSYKDQLASLRAKGADHEGLLCGEGSLKGIPVQIGLFDFRFMGGSMGAVVGEKIFRVLTRAAQKQQPAILVSSSGGARMQEGIVSLMQMAKTCAALGELRDRGVPFISILTNPTTGGVAASFALLGDINIAEPGALIGFAGPRVIRQTIGQELPEGFQRAEYLLEHGMVDLIVHRGSQRAKLADLLKVLCKRPTLAP